MASDKYVINQMAHQMNSTAISHHDRRTLSKSRDGISGEKYPSDFQPLRPTQLFAKLSATPFCMIITLFHRAFPMIFHKYTHTQMDSTSVPESGRRQGNEPKLNKYPEEDRCISSCSRTGREIPATGRGLRGRERKTMIIWDGPRKMNNNKRCIEQWNKGRSFYTFAYT